MNQVVSDNHNDEAASPIAAIDLGSNSFHMIVAQPMDGNLRIIDKLRDSVRLAAGLDNKNRISDDAAERALKCLELFGQRLRDMPAGSVRVVGTNTLRKARNSRDFLIQATTALGHPVEVIAGREEARLIYLGVSHSLPDSAERRLVVDIGGGSTEVIIGKRFESLHRESLYMGCVSFSRNYFPDGVVNEANMANALLAARLELEPMEADYRRIGWRDAVGASGTIKALGAVVREMGWSDNGITLESLHKMKEALLKAGHVDKVELKGLKDDRRPVLAGGLAVLLAIFEALRIEQMQVSEWALREGLLYDLMGRIRHEDVRERTINALMERYHADASQAQRVERTASQFLDQVAKTWNLSGDESSNLLSWAAQLHEIGLAIAHNQHHKHAAYLIEHSDLPGFSREEQRQLAALVRSHRRKFPSAPFKDMSKEQSSRCQRLAMLLRLSVALHRSRSDQSLPTIRLEAKEGSRKLAMQFPDNWLAEHPLTAADLQMEAEFLKAGRFTLILK